MTTVIDILQVTLLVDTMNQHENVERKMTSFDGTISSVRYRYAAEHCGLKDLRKANIDEELANSAELMMRDSANIVSRHSEQLETCHVMLGANDMNDVCKHLRELKRLVVYGLVIFIVFKYSTWLQELQIDCEADGSYKR